MYSHILFAITVKQTVALNNVFLESVKIINLKIMDSCIQVYLILLHFAIVCITDVAFLK